MIQFDIITIFPKFFDSFLNESIIKRAQKQKLIKIRVFNLRAYAKGKHGAVDDKPFGGGRGMVLKLEPIYKCLKSIAKSKIPDTKYKMLDTKTILFSPRGKKFTQQMAYRYSKLKRIIMVCGRYEAIDERVAKHLVNEQISIGDYVMMGGEVAAMAVIESVSRLIPGVLGHSELLPERIVRLSSELKQNLGGFTEYPQYTRPEVFNPEKGKSWKAPKVLLKGNHKKIQEWREKHQKVII